jgi:hypothetical protein
LEVVLESVKMPPPSSIKATGCKTEDVIEIITLALLLMPRRDLRKLHQKIL